MPAPARPWAVLLLIAVVAACSPPAPSGDATPPGPDAIEGDY